jgi:hypothetical protein
VLPKVNHEPSEIELTLSPELPSRRYCIAMPAL